ncbi:hypothetical protein ACIQLK_05695 [Microbacterium sp. NPDC091382]|uniref:hypothetical protein n=1 Tax=Microbacterium sp. NPDC091382 TaxID=3364210 RepID=UPI00382830E0
MTSVQRPQRWMAKRPGGVWLPAHQEHVLYSLAHIDATVESLTLALEGYLALDPLQLKARYTSTHEEVVLVGTLPLPEAVPRLLADALNQMRNVLEHTLYAEVLLRVGRDLTEAEARALEVPAAEKEEDFHGWTRRKDRVSLGLFDLGSELRERLHRLQPLHRRDSASHPLRALVGHTNFAKHREPAVALTRVGRVDLDSDVVRKPLGHRDHVQVGDVLASVPLGVREGVSVWPDVVVQRPSSGEWITLMKEVTYIEEWVRKQAIPILIAGTTEGPPIPPHLDTLVGYANIQSAWSAAGPSSATQRMVRRMSGEGLRRDLLEMLAGQYGEEHRAAFEAWLRSMDSGTVLDRFKPVISAVSRGNEEAWDRAVSEWLAEAGVIA